MAAPMGKISVLRNVMFSCQKCFLARYSSSTVTSKGVRHDEASNVNQESERETYPHPDGATSSYTKSRDRVDDFLTCFRSHRSNENDKLYQGHIPTTPFQKGLLAAGSGVTAFFSPWRDDMVHYFGETTGYLALRWMRQKMMDDPVGRQILEEKPRINSSTVDLDYLSKLPPGTLGREYITFLETNNITPDDRLCVSFIDDVDLAFTLTRYREVHDLVHTVLGMPTNMLGEVVVKWVEAIQTGLPMCFLGALFSPLRFGPVYRQRYLSAYWAWSLRVGAQSKTLLNVYFERHWEDNLEELKREWNIEPLPVVK
ncbi:ubiquinone biosynthesis protein COQ4 homolog, mitochondrial-like [Lineus longissimus]|uniref:ubiquinone biosynthesis protein COQ4 homolog, mitochondrial-like n=1 Tax=Lineus longissimus TaxID=88925 RepID=UPI002B4E9765